MLKIDPQVPFNPNHFTKREFRFLHEIAEEYKNARANKMIEDTHLENRPWHQVYEVLDKKKALIPYELALKKQEKEEMVSEIKETKDFWETYQ